MKTISLSLLLLFVSNQVFAALEVGTDAPGFSAPGSIAGSPFEFTLETALEKGHVVLYFYPKAFTPGCTIEAHEFAEATDEFASYGATVIGVSADDLDTLHEFSVSECRDKFAVISDPDQNIIQAYDAVLAKRPSLADRISYVISPEGEIIHVHAANDPHGHITETLNAVKMAVSAE